MACSSSIYEESVASETSNDADRPAMAENKDPQSVEGRSFYLKCRIQGIDTLVPTKCILDESLCPLCTDFIKRTLTETGFGHIGKHWKWQQLDAHLHLLVVQHYSSSRLLLASANSGCLMCAKIHECTRPAATDRYLLGLGPPRWEADDPYRHGGTSEDWFTFTVLKDRRLDYLSPLEPMFQFMMAKDIPDCSNLPLVYEDAYVRENEGSLKFPAPCKLSEKAIATVKGWRRDCLENHSNCRRENLPLPLRLMEIDLIGNGVTSSVRVVSTKDIVRDEAKYIALSYCWGGWTGLTLKTHNLNQMQHGIDLDSLPAIVIDAVKFCRQHGMKYLWVDSFCICQDDVVEWESEARNMTYIYGGCEFALSVLNSSGADEGFLGAQELVPTALGQANVSYGKWSDSVQLFIRRVPRSLRHEMECAPLNRRAWPLQEKVLAPAVVHVGQDQLIWECNTHHLISETGQKLTDRNHVVRISNDRIAGGFWHESTWAKLIEQFTSREITYIKDRHIAISGIAGKLRSSGIYSGRYVAGIWETDLELQLLSYPRDATLEDFSNVADILPGSPTWSWTHWNLPVHAYPGSDTALLPHSPPPSSALSTSPKFHFFDQTTNQESLLTNAAAYCAIQIHGFIQKIGEGAMLNSRRSKYKSGSNFYGLPGRWSQWLFDKEPVASGPLFCLRMLESAPLDEKSQLRSYDQRLVSAIYYLVIRQDERGFEKVNERIQTVYSRVGLLILYGMESPHFQRPYPPVNCNNGGPLLLEGDWEKLLLV